jgi:uroporphyrinogen-III decarboxylase
MLFDTWGGILSDAGVCEFSLAYMEQIASTSSASERGDAYP